MIQSPLRQWLGLRIRMVCVVVFVIGGFLPPYIPRDALAMSEEDLDIDTPQLLLVEDGFLMKSSSLTVQGARRAYAEGILHTVRDGDNLQRIAGRYSVSVDTIIWANGLNRNATLRPGQELVILPVDGVFHIVSRGQTLQQISELYAVGVSAIAEQNKVQNNFILAGQQLIIPGGKPILLAGNQALRFSPSVGGFDGEIPVPVPPRAPAYTPGSAIQPVPTAGLLGMPCGNCFYTQYYRPGHYAVDIQTKGGGPIFAAEAGEVIRADMGWNGGYGNVVEIDHGNGLVTLYGHNKALSVKVGDSVTRGQKIADMGNTGRVYGATGIHIHFEVRSNGDKKNPLLYLK